jgi:hypothetical protein
VILRELEARLDPAKPEESGRRVLAHGEISATLLLRDQVMAGLVATAISSSPDPSAVELWSWTRW